MSIVRLRQLRYFIFLAYTLNLHGAAERFNMSQPLLTDAICKLEQEYGTDPIERDACEAKFTPAGLATLPAKERAVGV